MKENSGRYLHPNMNIPRNVQVLHHNVAGEDGVLSAMNADKSKSLVDHYNTRATDHVFRVNGHIEQAYVLGDPSSYELQAQLSYRGENSGTNFEIVPDLETIIDGDGIEQILYIPYIRRKDHDNEQVSTYGLSPEVIRQLKHKGRFHHWMVARGFGEYVPEFVTTETERFQQDGMKMVEKITQLYELADMGDEYPVGLMIRSSDSDGQYGSGILKQVIAKGPLQGKIVFLPNGKSDELESYDNWEQALERLNEFLNTHIDQNKDSDLVLTRLLDLEDSPGVQVLVNDDDIYIANWNGQYRSDADTVACTGTVSYQSTQKAYLEKQYGKKASQVTDKIVRQAITDYGNSSEEHAIFNADLMIVADLEKKLHQRLVQMGIQSDFLRKHSYGNNSSDTYVPRVIAPDEFTYAEFNWRLTNYSLAALSVMNELGIPATDHNYLHTISNPEITIASLDAWQQPERIGQNYKRLREEIIAINTQLAINSGKVTLRMPDSPAGIYAYSTNSAYPATQVLKDLDERISQ